MAKKIDYNDLTSYKTPAEQRKNGQVKRILADIEKIDSAVKSNDVDLLTDIHRELDGIYQNRIKNWGNGMFNYYKDAGFFYEYIDESSLKDNLKTMKSKLQGLLFDIDPDVEISNTQKQINKTGRGIMTPMQKKMISDFAEFKNRSVHNHAFTIYGNEYPLYKDTLDYMERYEYIIDLNLDYGGNKMYIKQPSFDSFTEHVLSIVEEEKTQTEFDNKKVFIVHGHDHQLLNDVELMLRRIGLDPIILKDKANKGRTIIEKIEALTDVGFGIVLYTACDEGRKKGDDALKDRARQNVIFEHGYLCAKLGRERVVAINDSGIEVPSDLSGILYIPRTDLNWKNQLMKEMSTAGLDFDATNV